MQGYLLDHSGDEGSKWVDPFERRWKGNLVVDLTMMFILSRWVRKMELSTCPFYTNSGCGKDRRILIGPW